MKKIVASVGLVALGATAFQTASAQELVGPDASKPWNVGVTLRGFYDDNTATWPDDQPVPAGYEKDSFGFEVTPSAAVTWALEQTTFNLGLLYSFKYYDNEPPNSNDHDSHVFTFNGGVAHRFSDQVSLRASDSFVIGQEPDLLRAGETFSTFQRADGDNIRNYATLALDAQLSPKIGLGLGYDNHLYNYDDDGAALVPIFPGNPFSPLVIGPSLSGLLDRMEHRAHVEGFYSLAPETKLLLGYRYMEVDYTGDEPIGGDPFFGPIVMSDDRNSRNHSVYVGAQHTFLPELTGAARVGVTMADYYNDPTTDEEYSPYVNATLRYGYATGSYAELGVSYDRNATDVIASGLSGYTLDAESLVIFGDLKHQFDPRLIGGLIAQFQNSTYNGGEANDDTEQYFMVGLNLEYKFNAFFSAHAGYNFDLLNSDLNRDFDRNRVYIGVTASY